MNAGQYEGLIRALGEIRDRLPDPDAPSKCLNTPEHPCPDVPVCGDPYHRHTGPCEIYARKSEHKSHYGVVGETTASACRNTDHEHFPGDPILESCRAHNADYAAWARDEIAKHHSADHGARPGPECTCVQASDTGHDPDCPRSAFARGAYTDTCLCRGSEDPHRLHFYGCVGPVQE